jgi:malonyl-ACP decarboxylase
MQVGRLHPTHNLEDPIDPDLPWVRANAIVAEIDYALSNSFGFGGINTALVLGRDAYL